MSHRIQSMLARQFHRRLPQGLRNPGLMRMRTAKLLQLPLQLQNGLSHRRGTRILQSSRPQRLIESNNPAHAPSRSPAGNSQCTGVIGQYVQGNQPDQQAAYYYDWGGQPWNTQKLTREILRLMYGSDKYGLAFPGMDDQGSTSSWYVMSALGFYPVDPSSPDYIMGSPLFKKAVIHMGDGHDFTIVARNDSAKDIYIQSATLNGKLWNKPWFSHSDIAEGAKLVLTMGAEPNRSWGSAAEDAPPSMTAPH